MEAIIVKRKLRYRLVLWWTMFLASLPAGNAAAQTYRAAPLPFASALPSKEITALHQDREGFLWIGTTNGAARYDGYATAVFKSDHSHPSRLTNNHITFITDTEHYVFVGTRNGLNIFCKATWSWTAPQDGPFARADIKHVYADSRARLWIATQQYLYRCNEKLHVARRYALGGTVTSVYEDRGGQIWALAWGGKGLFRHDEPTDRFLPLPPVGRDNIPFVLYQDRDRRYWLGTWGDGLYRFYPQKSGEEMYERQDVPGDIYFDIEQDDRNGWLWTLSFDALHVYRYDGRLRPCPSPASFDRSRMFSTVLKDHEGNLWLGAFDAGFRLTFPPAGVQGHTLPFIKRETGADPNLNCLHEDDEGVVWFNQDRQGLGFYDPATGQYALHPYPQPRPIEVSHITRAQGQHAAWVSSPYVPVVFRAERRGLKLHFTDTLRLPASSTVTSLCEDRRHRLWISTDRQLLVCQPDDRASGAPAVVRETGIYALTEGHDGRIWMADADGSLLCNHVPSPETSAEGTKSYPIPVDARHLPVRHICAAPNGLVWVATNLGGLLCLDTRTGTWTDHTEACLPDMPPILYLGCRDSLLWAITPGYVVCYHPARRTRQVYDTGSQLFPIQTFRDHTAGMSPDGVLYAGGHGGLVAIDTRKPATAASTYPMTLSDLRVEGKSLLSGPAPRGQMENRTILLPPTATRMEFLFSAFDYSQPENLRMAYRLEGLDTATVMALKGDNRISYDRLPKGTYTLRVWSTDENGKATGKPGTYTLIKQPAWFETWTARLLYALAGLSLLACMVVLYARRIRKKNARLLREEMTRIKMEYFTNMSHELLTPLTILSCLSDEIEQNSPAGSPVARSMRDNVNRLRKLIRQVLDFRKIEQKRLPLQVRYGDVASFVGHIGRADFTLLAQKKDIDFRMDLEPEEAYGFFDADKLEEMLFNLLSNAIKYTPPGHAVGIRLRVAGNDAGKRLHLDVWDEGPGIAPEEQDKVFTRFYRSPHGTGAESNGIGLSLARELAALHHGTLTLQSSEGKGCCFTLEIPLDETAYSAEERGGAADAAPPSVGTAQTQEPDARPTLLIVDDNAEITDSIARLTGQRYRILPAHSAAEAAPLLQEQNIDLMVCDLRMPGMSGLDFCRTIKGDLATSHIPVVILTAQDSDATRAACYEAGADGYVAKPFDLQVLTTRIDNLLHQYRQHNRQFLHTPDMNADSLPYQDRDKAFLEDLVAAVESHLADSGFKLDSLSSELRLSKSTMNRKIKAMTGLTPMDFVKGVRLRSACRLLREGKMTVSEIAYTVGFSDPKYFAKCFKEEYGQTPSQFQGKNE